MVHIFHVNKAKLIKVYILPDETYEHLQGHIAEQTEFSENSQILIYQNTLFSRLVAEDTRAVGYPTTTKEDPIFLFHRENNNITIDPDPELPKFTDFLTVISVENDAAQAKFACSIGHQCKRQIEKASLHSNLIFSTVENLTKYIKSELLQLYTDTQHLADKYAIYKKQTEIVALTQQIIEYNTRYDFQQKLDSISKEFITSSAVNVTNLHKAHCRDDTLKLQWDSLSRELKCPYKTLAPARAKTQVEHLRDSWQHLVRDRATRSLSYNDEQFHILERLKITQTINRLKGEYLLFHMY